MSTQASTLLGIDQEQISMVASGKIGPSTGLTQETTVVAIGMSCPFQFDDTAHQRNKLTCST